MQKFPTFRTNELPPFTTSNNKPHNRCQQLILKSHRLSAEKIINRFHGIYVALFTETHQQTLTPESVQCIIHFYPSFHPEVSLMLSFHRRNYLPHGLYSRCSTTKILSLFSLSMPTTCHTHSSDCIHDRKVRRRYYKL